MAKSKRHAAQTRLPLQAQYSSPGAISRPQSVHSKIWRLMRCEKCRFIPPSKKSKKVLTKWDLSAKINPAVGTAGVAQLVEQLICNQQVGGSNPSTSSKLNMGEFQSGQMGQTVNLLSLTSGVRIHLPPPIERRHLSAFDFLLSERKCLLSAGHTAPGDRRWNVRMSNLRIFCIRNK